MWHHIWRHKASHTECLVAIATCGARRVMPSSSPFPGVEFSGFKVGSRPILTPNFLPLSPCKGWVLSAFHSMLVVEFSSTSFEVKLGLTHRILKLGEMSYFKGGNWAWTIVERVIKCVVFSLSLSLPPLPTPKKRGPLIHQIHMENTWNCSCDPLGGNNSIVDHLRLFSCKNVWTVMGWRPCNWMQRVP